MQHCSYMLQAQLQCLNKKLNMKQEKNALLEKAPGLKYKMLYPINLETESLPCFENFQWENSWHVARISVPLLLNYYWLGVNFMLWCLNFFQFLKIVSCAGFLWLTRNLYHKLLVYPMSVNISAFTFGANVHYRTLA
jgi:hypothetical protein